MSCIPRKNEFTNDWKRLIKIHAIPVVCVWLTCIIHVYSEYFQKEDIKHEVYKYEKIIQKVKEKV